MQRLGIFAASEILADLVTRLKKIRKSSGREIVLHDTGSPAPGPAKKFILHGKSRFTESTPGRLALA
jgi:hypothetical protein